MIAGGNPDDADGDEQTAVRQAPSPSMTPPGPGLVARLKAFTAKKY
jgi:hypothetical protein